MGQVEKSLATAIRKIADNSQGKRFTVMMGVVVAGSVDETQNTCKVVLSKDDDDTPTEGVMLNGIQLNSNGFILYPADNSYVWVAEIDGPGKYGIVRCSDLVKVTCTAGAAQLTIEGGKFQIMNGSANLTTILQNILTHILALTVPTPAGNSGVALNAADFNNDLTDVNNLLY